MVNGKANEAFETMEKIGGTEQANAQLAEMKEVVKEETKGFGICIASSYLTG